MCVCVSVCKPHSPAQVSTLRLDEGGHDSDEEAQLNILHYQHPQENTAVVQVS